MTKHLSVIGALALGAIAMWIFGPQKIEVRPPPQAPLMSLEQMGHLVSVKVNYSNVIESFEKRAQDIPGTPWELRLGGTKVLLVARGDCLVGTDLRLAKYQEVDQSKRSADLVLPAPQTISARVNHASRENGGSYFYAITNSGIEPIVPGSNNQTKATDTALRQAEQDIAKVCSGVDVIATAKKNTEAILLPTFSASGWKINIRWIN